MAGSLALTSKSRLRRPRVAKIRETKGRASGGRPQLAGRVLAGLGAVLAQVEVEDLGRFAVGAQPAVVEPEAARTVVEHRLRTVGNEDHRLAGVVETAQTLHALGGERGVADGEHLVENEDVR